MPEETAYTIADLARLTGLNVRTIRYYLAQGLIPASGESGPGAHYGQGHLDRLGLTKRLQQQHLPLAEIRQRLAALSDDEVADLLVTKHELEAPDTSALDYVRSVLGSSARNASAPRLAMPSSPPPAALLSMPAPGAAQQGPGRLPDARRLSRVLRESPPGMPRMKDIPAQDPRVAAAEAMAFYQPGVAAKSSSEPQPLERSQWERHSLGPNIELHVRRPLSRLEQRRVERLITIARQVLKEDGV